jgi:hypothetical protein
MKAVEARKGLSVRTKAGAGRFLPAISVAILVVVVLLVSMVLGAAPARGQWFTGPNVLTPEPNPFLEGNATFATHGSNWATLEYSAGSTYGNLSARLDTNVKNPIQVIGPDVISPIIQGEKIAGHYWNATTAGSYNTVSPTQGWVSDVALGGGATNTGPTVVTLNGVQAVQFTFNFSSQASNHYYRGDAFVFPDAALPSTTLQFDYVTESYTISVPACPAGKTCTFLPEVSNLTGNAGSEAPNSFGYYAKNGSVSPAGVSSGATTSVTWTTATTITGYFSASLYQLGTAVGGTPNFATSTSVGVFVAPQLQISAAATSGLFTVDITGLALSTAPLTLGSTIWNGVSIARGNAFGTGTTGALNLTSLGPSYTYTSIAGGGFSTAIVQSANDLSSASITTTSNAVSVANASGGPGYVEQVTYNYAYGFPLASGVSYGAFKMVDQPEVTGAQYSVVTIGGTAYTTTYQAFLPGSENVVVASVSPTATTYWVGVVYFTGSQWDSISAPPGLFSSGGLNYIWFEIIGVGVTIVTLGGASAWVISNERGLRVRKGTVYLPGAGPRDGTPFGKRWRAADRKLRQNRSGMGARHGAMISLGLISIGAAAITAWAVAAGADPQGAAGAFLAGFFVLLVVSAIAFVVYEIAHWARHRKRR